MRIEKNANFGCVKLLIALMALFITPRGTKAATSAAGEVDVSIQYQIIEGFGASGAWYENWLYPGHPKKEELYDLLFDELGLDIYRLRNTYDQATGGGALYMSRSAEIVAAAKLRNPTIKIMISSWSPPKYLKSNDDLVGGTLIKDANGDYMYEEFAQWWADSLDAWDALDVNADYINMQNEPYVIVSHDSCRFFPVETTNLAGYREAFEGLYNKLSPRPDCPKLLAPETAGIGWCSGYIDYLYNTDHVYGYAHHLYDGESNAPDDYIPDMEDFAEDYGYKPLFQTEFAKGNQPDPITFDEAMNLAILMHNSLTVEQISSYLYWELFWEEPKGLVSFPTYGSSSYTINPVYYAFKHYSAFTDPNWQRVEASTDSYPDLRISAYMSPDSNHMSVVIINTSTSTDIALTLSFNDITVVDGDVYRTSETEDCVLVSPFSQPLTLPASSITTVALTTSLDTTPPAAPTNLLAAAGDEIVWLDWDDNTEPDFVGYNIYRSTTPGSYTDPLNTSPLDSSDYTDSDVNNGMTYYYVVTAEDTSTNESNYSSEVSASPSSAIGAMGTILREWWTGISGGLVSDLTSDPNFPDNPTNIEYIKSLEGPTDWADSYGARISGYVHPPNSGDYTFWIASDANSELWLSTNGNPENASLIAEVNVPGYTDRRQWDKYPQQQSSPISLTAGQKYYIEVLHKEDTGTDNVAVAWQGPGIARQVIYGVYLSPFFTGYYGDFTDDGEVDMNDVAELIELWLEEDCQETSAMDLDGDCIINFYEFSAMAENWLKIIAPSAPANLSITAAGETSVSLDWDDNLEPNLAGYNVYRSTTSGSDYSKLNSSILTGSDYTDDAATNGNTYYYVVTAVDIYSNESGYSNEVSRLVIQENTTGFCGVDGYVKTEGSGANPGYTGIGYADTLNDPNKGVYWRINVPSSGTYTFAWRFDNGTTSDRPGDLFVDGSPVESGISFPGSGSWSDWRFVSVDEPLTAGTRDICLKSPNDATGDNGLANIDYLMVVGSDSLTPESCP